MRATSPSICVEERPAASTLPASRFARMKGFASQSSMIRVLLAVLCVSVPVGLAQAREIRVAVLAFQGSERAARDFEQTFEYLGDALPEHRFVMVPLDLAGISRAVLSNSVEFVITNPGNYVELEGRFGVTRVATFETRVNNVAIDTVGSTLIVRNRHDHPTDLKGLVGAKIAVVAAGAFGGWQVVWREFEDAGVPLTKIGGLVETGFPMSKVIEEVRAGRVDAGVLRTCLLEEEVAAGRASADEFAIVAEKDPGGYPCRRSSRLYPDWAFARLASTSGDLAKSVTAKLLEMVPSDGRGWTAPQDYNSVLALFRDLKIGPFEHLSRVTLFGFMREHWHWFAIAAVGLGWWIVHVARVETLVRRRTAELTREIQERGRAEEEARTHRQERDQFSRLGILGEMASNIAHELNQPLAAITNYAEGMTRLIDAGRNDPAILRDGARGIAGQAERAGTIVRRIRSFVRRREIRRENLDINEVVREALLLFEGTAKRCNIPFHVRLAADLPQVKADRIEIEQVLLNLFQNAVDAMGTAEQPERGIVVSTRRTDDKVEVAVRDHGTGLAPDVDARLFETFFTTKPQGLGLGLSICRSIVESHGGRLWASNEQTGGLSMRFALPVQSEDGE